MNETHPCVNGCHTRPDSDGNRRPVYTGSRSLLCGHCEDRLGSWLEAIPTTYALLPEVLEPGSVDRNPQSKATKRCEAPTPVRLDAIDLVDDRAGWQHGAIDLVWRRSDNRRGTLGILESWARLVREEKPLTVSKTPATVVSEAGLLSRHLLWITEQPWVDELYADIQALHRALSDAVGDYRPRPVGRCHIIDEGEPCGGPLMPSRDGGVRCARCSASWDAEHLRQLGLALTEESV